MSSEIFIRRPETKDFDAVLECLISYRLHRLGGSKFVDPDFPADSLLTVRNTFCIVDFVNRAWVAEKDGDVLGFCCWDWMDQTMGIAKTVLITVRQEARKLGVGYLLQLARQEEMRAAGAVELHTWSDDPKAIEWYCKKFGYRPQGVEPIHHCLHLFLCGPRAAWGIHRGHVQYAQLTHLRLDLTHRMSSADELSKNGSGKASLRQT